MKVLFCLLLLVGSWEIDAKDSAFLDALEMTVLEDSLCDQSKIRMAISICTIRPTQQIGGGKRLFFMVKEDIVVDGSIVVAAGATAVGTIRMTERDINGALVSIGVNFESVQGTSGQLLSLKGKQQQILARYSDCTQGKICIKADLTVMVAL